MDDLEFLKKLADCNDKEQSDEDMQFFLEDIYANGWTDAVEDSSNNRVDWETWLQQPAEEVP